jgi:hypothetical protein
MYETTVGCNSKEDWQERTLCGNNRKVNKEKMVKNKKKKEK